MRSVRGSNWNKAITPLPLHSGTIRQEHWSKWRAHKMCIADCLQCSLGLAWREEPQALQIYVWARVCVCVCVCACICADSSVSSPFSLSPLVFILIWTPEREESISLCRATRRRGEQAPKQQTSETRQKIWQTHRRSFISFSFLPLNFPCPAETAVPASPRQLLSSWYVWAT